MTPRRVLLALILVIFVALQSGFAVRSLGGSLYASRGDAATAQDRLADADALYATATRLVPYRGDWRYAHAGVVRRESGHEAALPVYDASLGRAPYSEPALVAKAESLIELDRMGEAATVLTEAYSLTPYDWRIHHLAGILALKQDRPKDAVASLRAAQDLAPTLDPLIQSPLATALFGTGAYADAEHEATRAIDLRPLEPQYRLVRGKALLALGRATDARKDLAWAARAYRNRITRGEEASIPLEESEERLASAFIAEGRPLDAIAPLDRLSADSPEAAGAAAERMLLWLHRQGRRAPIELWALVIDMLAESGRFEPADDSLNRCRAFFRDDTTGALIAPEARLALSNGDSLRALELLRNAPDAIRSDALFRLAEAQAQATSGNSATASLVFEALLADPQLSPRVRRMAGEGLAAIRNQ